MRECVEFSAWWFVPSNPFFSGAGWRYAAAFSAYEPDAICAKADKLGMTIIQGIFWRQGYGKHFVAYWQHRYLVDMYRCTCVSGLCESSICTPEPKPPRGIHYSKNEWKIANWASAATVVWSRIAQAHAFAKLWDWLAHTLALNIRGTQSEFEFVHASGSS